jgi:hypothetical protein
MPNSTSALQHAGQPCTCHVTLDCDRPAKMAAATCRLATIQLSACTHRK